MRGSYFGQRPHDQRIDLSLERTIKDKGIMIQCLASIYGIDRLSWYVRVGIKRRSSLRLAAVREKKKLASKIPAS
jgi:hypothetical protein